MGENSGKRKKKTVTELSEEIMCMGENSVKRKKKTVTELSEEIMCEIMTRLPVKYVVRFKCVSKYWQSVVSAPQFVKQYLICSATENPNYHDCVIPKKYNKIFMLSRYKETYMLRSNNYQLIGSINGLVCLGSGKKLSLWNPAIHQYKEATLPASRDLNYRNIGLGYDPENNNYKIVVLSVDLRSAKVYNSNSDSWIDITFANNVFSKNALEESTSTTIVKDCPYWTCSRRSPDKSLVLSLAVVKFDARSNNFKLLPEFCPGIYASQRSYKMHYKFLDMTDHLALIVLDRSSTNFMVDIYSLEGEEGCCAWIKMRSLGPIIFDNRHSVSVLQGFKYGGEVVFCLNGGFIFCYDYNKISGMISFFDIKTGAIKPLNGTSSCTHNGYVSCFRYTPTLAFVQGMKSVYSSTQSHTPHRYREPGRLISSLENK